MTPKPGDSVRFVGVDVDGQRVAVGNMPGRIDVGTVMVVREVVPASEPGAHDDSEDAVVLSFVTPEAIVVDGEAVLVDVLRAWSVGVSEFDDLFEGV